MHNRISAVEVPLLLALLVLSLFACKSPSSTGRGIAGKWFATTTRTDILVEKTEYVLNLRADFTYHMESERSRKVGDHDYYAEIAGSYRKFDGEWELSDDGYTISFLMPELEGDERASIFAEMELTVSEDRATLTRSDINFEMVRLVFTRE